MLVANQKVAIKPAPDGTMMVMCLQNKSTPGVYQRYTVVPNSSYQIEASGWTDDGVSVRLWIGDPERETLYFSKDSLPGSKAANKSLKATFNTGAYSLIHIGVLFDNMNRGGLQGMVFILHKLTATLLKTRVSNIKSAPIRRRSKEQREQQEKILKSYDKYWRKIIEIIEGEPTLETAWSNVLEYEYKNTVRNFIYQEGNEYPYTGPKQFYEVFEYSRKPLLDLISANFGPEQKGAVIELGAGWGKNLFYCVIQDASTEIDYYGLELTAAGVEAIKRTAELFTPQYSISAQTFDLEFPQYNLAQQYDTVAVFSMWSLKEITNLNKMVFYKLLDLAPRVVGLHLEPIGWQVTGKGKPYKHFNQNLFKILLELQQENRIQILEVIPDWIGIFSVVNTATLIRWQSSPRHS